MVSLPSLVPLRILLFLSSPLVSLVRSVSFSEIQLCRLWVLVQY